jgi:Mu transposase-like protein
VDPTPVYDPGKKGKVESGVKYVKRNFFRGRSGQDVDLVAPALHRWVHEIAGTREHGTTHRRPLEVFRELEQAVLKPLPARRFEPVLWRQATVHRDSHVIFEKRLYSVPWKLIEKVVWVRATASTVAIFFDDTRVATHDRRGPGHRSTVDAHLPEHRADLRHRSRSYWEQRAGRIGPDTLRRWVGALGKRSQREVPLRREAVSATAAKTHIETHIGGQDMKRPSSLFYAMTGAY